MSRFSAGIRNLFLCSVILLAGSTGTLQAQGGVMKILTINAWTGLDYHGFFRMGEYESREDREARFRSLVAQVAELAPDVIFLQEANPAGAFAARLAEALSMDQIHQVTNAGIKVGSVGFPSNLKEGLVILASPGLALEKLDGWKLSGPPGVHTDLLSLQLHEVTFALAGRVEVRGRGVVLVNVHLAAAPGVPEDLESFRREVLARGDLDEGQFRDGLARWQGRVARRLAEVRTLLGRLKGTCGEGPCVVAGDFNAVPDSEEMRIFMEEGGFTEGPEEAAPEGEAGFTWDPDRNRNVTVSAVIRDGRGRVREGFDYLAAVANDQPRKLDYVFVPKDPEGLRIVSRKVVLTGSVAGVQVSDHFGVLAEVELVRGGN